MSAATNELKKGRKAVEVLKALGELSDPHVALLLLRNCASLGKLVFSLRVTSHRLHRDTLKNFYEAVRYLESCVSLSLCNWEWSLALLSTKLSGLSLHSAAVHGPAAYFSAQCACQELCGKVSPGFVEDLRAEASKLMLLFFNASVQQEDQISFKSCAPVRQKAVSSGIGKHLLDQIRDNHANDANF